MRIYKIRKTRKLITALILVGSFFFIPVNTVLAQALYYGNYTKPINGTLNNSDWNLLKADFLNKRGSALLDGSLNLTSGYSISADTLQGKINASYITPGDFNTSDSSSTGGNFSFPVNLGIGIKVPKHALDVSGNINFTGDLLKDGSAFVTSKWKSNGDKIYYNAGINGNVGIGTSNPTKKLEVVGEGKFSGVVDGGTPVSNQTSAFTTVEYVDAIFTNPSSTLGFWSRNNIDNSIYYKTGNIGIGTDIPTSLLTLANNKWLSAISGSGTGGVNMFKLNANNQIEVGAPLLIGPLEFASNSGLVSFLDMPITSSSPLGTPHGYVMRLDGNNILTTYAESDGSGGIRNSRVGIGTAMPSAKLEITGETSPALKLTSSLNPAYNVTLQAIADPNHQMSLSVLGSEILGRYGANTALMTGSLGLGTTNPSSLYKLDVVGGAKFTQVVDGITPLETQTNALTTVSYVNSALSNPTTAVVGFWTKNGNNIFNNNSANVGIGKTNPTQKLDVTGNALVSGNINTNTLTVSGTGNSSFVGNVGVGTSNPATKFVVKDNSYRMAFEIDNPTLTNKTGLSFARDGVSMYEFSLRPNDNDWALYRRELSGAGGWYKAINVSMERGDVNLVESIGNVGIGKANPGYKLDVAGGAKFTAVVDGVTPLETQTNALTTVSYVNSALSNPTTAIVGFWTKNADNSIYNTNLANVGIGKTNPTQKLDVAGNIKFNNHLQSSSIEKIIPIVIRGVGNLQNSNSILKIGENTVYSGGGRGLRLTIINKIDGSVVSTNSYDTYVNTTASDNLSAALDGMDKSQLGVITSWDAWERAVTTNLKNSFLRLGLFKAFALNSGIRQPYAAIFESASNLASARNAVESLNTGTVDEPYAEIRGWIIDGSFVASSANLNALTNPQGDLISLLVNSSGNIGIGTTIPTYKLDVAGGAKFTAVVDGVTPLETQTNALTTVSYVNSALSNPTTAIVGFWKKDGDNISNTNSANVGIGKTNPSEKLDVVGNAIVSGNVNTGTLTASGSGDSSFVGKVGIGVISPGEKLEVAGKIKIPGNIMETYFQSDKWALRNVYTGGGWARSLMVVEDSSQDTYFQIGAAGSGQNFSYGYLGKIYSDPTIKWYPNKNVEFWGNVGVGKNSSTYKLDVAGGAKFTAVVDGITPLETQTNALTTVSYVNSALSSPTTAIVGFWKKDGNNISNTNSANVGIGKTNPSQKLDVVGNALVSGSVGIGTSETYDKLSVEGVIGSGKIGGSGEIRSYQDINSTVWVSLKTDKATARSGIYRSNTDFFLYYDTGTGSTNLVSTIANQPIIFKNRSTELARIISSGNIGIGTTNPVYKLDVAGGAKFTAVVDGMTPLETQTNALTTVSYVNSALSSPTTDIVGFWKKDGNNISNTNSANIGIGKTNPTHKLDVVGNALVSGNIDTNTLTVSGSGNSSFVGNVGIGTTNPIAKLQIGNNWINGGSSTIYLGSSGFAKTNLLPEQIITINSTSTVPGQNIGLALHNSTATAGSYAPLLVFSTMETGPSTYNGSISAIGARTVTGSGAGNSYIDGEMMFYTAPTLGTGLVERMRITEFGNVGIGKTNPGYKLDVIGGAKFTAVVDGVTPLETQTNALTTVSYVNSALSNPTTAIVGFWKKDGDNISNTNSANVGIGKTNPTQKLDVTGNALVSGNVNANTLTVSGAGNSSFAGNVGIGTSEPANKLSIETSNGQGINLTFNNGNNNFSKWERSALNNNTVFGSISNNDVEFVTNNTERMRISNSGNVGIGNTNPLAKMDVSSSAGFTRVIKVGSGSSTVGSGSYIEFPSSASDGYGAQIGGVRGALNTGAGDLVIRTGMNNQQERVRVMDRGNVGIGTTNPTYKLHVVGGANFAAVVDGVTPLETQTNALTTVSYVNSALSNPTTAIVGFWTKNADNSIYNTNLANVGIGKTNPTQKLDVSGGATFSDNVGIGTSEPLAKIHIVTGESAAYNPIRLSNDNVTNNLSATGILFGVGGAGGVAKGGIAYLRSNNYARGDIHFLQNNNSDINDAAISDSVMTIKSSGNVGIGKTNPTYKLDVAGGAKFTQVIDGVTPLETQTNALTTVSYVNSALSNPTTAIVGFWTKNGNNIFNNNSANVGIGKTNPSQKLDVVGNTLVSGNVNANTLTVSGSGNSSFVGNVGIGTINSNVKLEIVGDLALNNSSTQSLLRLNRPLNSGVSFAQGADFAVGRGITYPSTQLRFMLDNGTNSVTNPQSMIMALDSSGKVGIGTITPAYKLDVAGGAKFTAVVEGITPLETQASALATVSYVTSALNNPTTATVGFWTKAGNNIYNTNTANVGIGTTNPGPNRLGVEGGLSVNGVIKGLGASNYLSGKLGINSPSEGGSSLSVSGGASIGASYFSYEAPSNGLIVQGNVGIGTTTPAAALHVMGNARFNSGITLGGDLIMTDDTLVVNKITANTIDPLYTIAGVKYSTFASAIVGGVKEEYIGRIGKQEFKKVGNMYQLEIDMKKLSKGSDMWVWYRVIDFSDNNVDIFLSPKGDTASMSAHVEGNKIIVKSDKKVDAYLRLIGKRFDWRDWPTRAIDQTQPGGLFID